MVLEQIAAISERVASEEQSYQELLIATARNKDDIHRLILNHAKPASQVADLVKKNHIAFKEYIEDAIKRGVIDEVIKTSNQYRYTMRHIHAIMNDLGIPSFKDKHGGSAHVIDIQNLKGGTGKSTTAVSVAVSFALDLKERKRVLLIDLDPQGSQSQFTNVDVENDTAILTAVDLMLAGLEENDLYDHLIEQGASHEEIVRDSMVETHLPNLDILPAFPDDERFNGDAWDAYSTALSQDPNAKMTHVSLLKEKIIDVVKDDYDVIIIDTAPQLNPLVWSAIEASNGLLVPCTPHALDWRATQSLFKALPHMCKNLPSGGKNLNWLKVLGVNYDDEFGRDDEILSRMKDALGSTLFNSQIKRSQAFEKASQNSMTVLDMRKSDKLCPPKQLEKAESSLRDVTRELSLFLKERS